jgi:hypothetical protein
MKRKDIWNVNLLSGFKLQTGIFVSKKINTVIGYTTSRTSLAIKNLTSFSPLVLRHKWVKEQITGIMDISSMSARRRVEAFGGYFPKRKHYFRKLKRILLSKPLFKHTSFNLIIDLFLFNNKTYKLKMLKNLILRRSTYKYMYSMYADYQTKIQETINRPRFFYMNIIDPRIFFYYKHIVNYYRALLTRKPFGIYLFLTLLQLNITNKQSTLSINNNRLNTDSSNIEIEKNFFNTTTHDGVNDFKTRLYTNSINRGKIESNKEESTSFPLKNNKKTNCQLYDIDKTLVDLGSNKNSTETKKKIKKNVVTKKPQYLKYKKYLNVLEKKTNKPLDPNSLIILNSENLGSNISTGDIKKIDESNKLQKKFIKGSGFVQNNRKRNIILNNKERDIDELLFNSGKKNMNPKFLFNKLKKVNKLKIDSINFDYTNKYFGNNENISIKNKDNNKDLLTKLSSSNIVKDINEKALTESNIKKSYYNKEGDNQGLDIFYASFYSNENDKGINIKKERNFNQTYSSLIQAEGLRLVINKKSMKNNIDLNKEELNKVNHELFSIKRSKYLCTSNKRKAISNKSL